MATNIKTSLYDEHVKLNAKIVPFGGFGMPVSYPKGIVSEHKAVREKVGMFDVSHMGEFWISGEDALEFLQHVTINDVRNLEIGDAQYSAMCYEDGGIVDDLILYRKNNGYFMVVNASNIDKDFKWLQSKNHFNCTIENHSDKYSLIAIQGPQSREILSSLSKEEIQLNFYSYMDATICDDSVMLSRTGYTGELGFEIYASHDSIVKIWQSLLHKGVEPCGLASRDVLRLEMKYCLYGNDIDNSTSPIEAGLSWITSFEKNNFIGREILHSQKVNKPQRKLITFELLERGIPRHDYLIEKEGEVIGNVTSGTQSISLSKGIGMAYVKHQFAKVGTEISIIIRNKSVKAKIVKSPFVKETSLLH
jgi:aminomethyltransferase